MSIDVVSPLRQRMIEDMKARQLGPHTQRSHIHSCKRFAAFLQRSPDTATPEEVRRSPVQTILSGPAGGAGCAYRRSNCRTDSSSLNKSRSSRRST